MRILHLDFGARMRGGQWQVLRLMAGLRERGHENVLLARTGSPLAFEAGRCGIETHGLTLLSVARFSHAGIIHAHDARSHTAAALSGCGPLVVSRRVAFPVHENPLSHWKYRRPARYIAVSRFVERMLLQAGIEAPKISVIYDGVPLLPISNGSELLVPHSADPAKGMDLALAAAKLAGFPVRVSTDLENDLPRAALFVYITQSEGLGSAVLLAMSAGVPVIASNVGGLPEIVEPERTGLLVSNTPKNIAEAIRRLMADRALAQSLGSRARQAVEEKFSAGRMVAQTLAVYEALV